MNIIEELEKNQNMNSARQIRGRFITQLSMMIEGFEKQYTVAQILHTLLRSQGDKDSPYFWNDEKLLQKAESQYRKMIKEIQNEDDEE